MPSLPTTFCSSNRDTGVRSLRHCVYPLLSKFEKIAMYADDILLVLGDTETSMDNAMSLILEFGFFSGYIINWEKLVPMSVHPLQHPLPPSASAIQVVLSFKYLVTHRFKMAPIT